MAHLILWNSYDAAKNLIVRPLGAHQLANWLAQHGYVVKVIDFCNIMTTSDLLALTNKFIGKETIAIGVSNTFWNANIFSTREPKWVLNARSLLEALHPKLHWIIGGSRNSYFITKFQLSWIKFFGYGEDSILKFLDEKTESSKIRKSFDIHRNFGHFHYARNSYIKPYEVLPLELSRGCQFKCKFCRYPLLGKTKNTYIRDMKLVEEELLYNYKKFGTTRYTIMDDTVNESTEKLEAMANIAQRLPFQLEWIGYVRLDLIGIKPYTADLLINSGLRGCYLGIESFHPKASLVVGKGWNGKHGKDFLLKLKNQWGKKVAINVGLIVGLTGETEKDLDETHNWCVDNEIHSWQWAALHLNKNPDQIWQSEFDREYAKYGYHFPTGNDSNWVNDDWSWQRAMDKANILNVERDNHVFVNPWEGAQLASLNHSFDELFSQKMNAIDHKLFLNKAASFVKNYVSYQRRL